MACFLSGLNLDQPSSSSGSFAKPEPHRTALCSELAGELMRRPIFPRATLGGSCLVGVPLVTTPCYEFQTAYTLFLLASSPGVSNTEMNPL